MRACRKQNTAWKLSACRETVRRNNVETGWNESKGEKKSAPCSTKDVHLKHGE